MGAAVAALPVAGRARRWGPAARVSLRHPILGWLLGFFAAPAAQRELQLEARVRLLERLAEMLP